MKTFATEIENGIAVRDIFTAKDIATLCDMAPNTFEVWFGRRIVRASLRSGGRRKRAFGWRDLFVAYVCSSIRAAGLPLTVIEQASRAIYDTEWLGENHYLTIVGDTVSIVTQEQAVELQSRGVPVIGCNLLTAADKLRKAVAFQLGHAASAKAGCN